MALGAIPGAWIRYALVSGGSRRLRQRHWATWGVNLLACFLLGLLMGLLPRGSQGAQDPLLLALAVGFLGSLSTYSTLMLELVTLWRGQGKRQALYLGAASLLGGLLVCALGFALGRSEA